MRFLEGPDPRVEAERIQEICLVNRALETLYAMA